MQNELNLSPENITPENSVQQTEQSFTTEPIYTFPPIAGFWRRFFAWFVDVLILGITGQIIGVLFSSFLFSVGPYGRLIGLLFTLPYFGIMNSSIGGGQTLGKRLMKIAVRNKSNEPIELWRSIVRILLLALPSLFNGWAVPIFQNPVISWVFSLTIFGLGGAIFYTMIFNREARQGIHDLLLGTYVVHLPDKPIESFPITPRIHWMISSVWVGIIAIGTLIIAIIVPSVISRTPLAPVMSLYTILQDDPRFFTVGVNDHTFYGSNGKTNHSLIITVWYKGKLTENDRKEVIKSIAKTVIENSENINNYDGIQVKITSAYDIGIARANITLSFGDSIEGWRKQIYPNDSPSGFIPFLLAKALAIP
jgi:uncharacterized RDD family membrane protein YckC